MELLMAVAFSVLLLTGVYTFYNASSQSYTAGISGENLQDGANTAMSKIIEGETESGTVYRLATAVAYLIPDGTANALYTCGGSAQASPCNTSNPFGELYYCQASPCTNSDPTARWYYLNSSGTSVIYHHPTSNGGTIEEKIYTAPAGSTLNLRFSPGQVGAPVGPSARVVEIDVDLAKTTFSNVTNARVATSGDISTFVLLRNHP